MRTPVPRHRRWLRGVLCAAGVLITLLTTAQPATAWHGIAASLCSKVTFIDGDVEVVVHDADIGGDQVHRLAMLNAIKDVHDQFNDVGATDASVFGSVANYTFSAEPFHFGDWYGDLRPTIHVGFVPSIAAGDAEGVAAGQAKTGPPVLLGPLLTCVYFEAHVQMLDMGYVWDLGTPGDGYYWARSYNTDTGRTYFRPHYLHELLHAFGLTHSDDSYAMMNYGTFPWFNGHNDPHRDDSIAPLPDDVQRLRHLYPASGGSHAEVALTNTWFDASDVSNSGAARQKLLCPPSLGTSRTTNVFDMAGCGTGGPKSGSDIVCGGEVLQTRFTVANYSTTAVGLEARLWFSTDDQWETSDMASSTVNTIYLSAANESVISVPWTVPDNLNTSPGGTVPPIYAERHVIVRITGSTSSGVSVHDWIPQTEPVRAMSAMDCRTPVPG
jgi:hypothetical protein